MSELLPRPIRLALGATSRGVGERALRGAVEGKVVLVTGASSGVGEAAARMVAGAGATVLLVARRREQLEQLRDQIAEAGGSAFVHPCDLSDDDQVRSLVGEVLEQHGNVDVLVSNAGISIRRWISETYERYDDIERTINTNYLGPARLVLGLLPSMRERGSGQIVSVSTIGVNLPPLRWSAYIASKTAFETWLAGVAPEVKPDGVSVSSIHLQLVRSPMLGPFRIWNYLPGMSTEEAASIIARAIVERPRTISPLWGRAIGAAEGFTRVPLETALGWWAGGGRNVVAGTLRAVSEGGRGARAIASMRMVRPIRPDRLAQAALATRRYGFTHAFLVALGAALYPDRTAVIDELGEVSFGELQRDADAVAAALSERFGLRCGDRVGIMCRNHRGFIQAAAGATRLGCDLVPLNSDFAAPQLGDVLARENVSAVFYDQEFERIVAGSGFEGARVLAWQEDEPDDVREEGSNLADLIATGVSGPAAPVPERPGRIITLTSGTTGTPKGATRTVNPAALLGLALPGLLDLGRIGTAPRSGEPLVVPPPLFHLYGMIGLALGFSLGSPLVLRRRFDPEATLEQVQLTGAGMLLAVPTMLKRIVDLPEEVLERYDTSSLRMIVSGAAPLPPELATAVMDRFGEILYNGYASTEVGSGTLATPQDLRAAPGTVGKPMAGVTVRILDDDGRELPPGETGRIFVGSPLLFEGYTGGGTKEVIDGLMSTGDVGHFDKAGRLFIDGRDDEMILSGGENVFPQEVEELLISHEAVADAAVFGVADDQFGQRLEAMAVLKDGRSVSEDSLKEFVRERLARYKVPREITFVERLPRTSTGKLQRRKLAEVQS